MSLRILSMNNVSNKRFASPQLNTSRVFFTSSKPIRGYTPLTYSEKHEFADIDDIKTKYYKEFDSEASKADPHFKQLNIHVFIKGTLNIAFLLLSAKAPWVYLLKGYMFDPLTDHATTYLTSKIKRSDFGDFIHQGILKINSVRDNVFQSMGLKVSEAHKLRFASRQRNDNSALCGNFIKDTLNIFKEFFTKKIDPNASESQKLSSSLELTNQILLTFSQIDEVQNEQKFAEISHLMATIQNVFSNLPKNCEHYSDLPQEKRYLLYSLMVDALTSEFKDIAKLGDHLAKAFGLKRSLVNKIKQEVSVIKSKSKGE